MRIIDKRSIYAWPSISVVTLYKEKEYCQNLFYLMYHTEQCFLIENILILASI